MGWKSGWRPFLRAVKDPQETNRVVADLVYDEIRSYHKFARSTFPAWATHSWKPRQLSVTGANSLKCFRSMLRCVVEEIVCYLLKIIRGGRRPPESHLFGFLPFGYDSIDSGFNFLSAKTFTAIDFRTALCDRSCKPFVVSSYSLQSIVDE
jgi:hypothetical protein